MLAMLDEKEAQTAEIGTFPAENALGLVEEDPMVGLPAPISAAQEQDLAQLPSAETPIKVIDFPAETYVQPAPAQQQIDAQLPAIEILSTREIVQQDSLVN